MRIFLVAYFVVPPQDLVPYAQRVMGAAALPAINIMMPEFNKIPEIRY